MKWIDHKPMNKKKIAIIGITVSLLFVLSFVLLNQSLEGTWYSESNQAFFFEGGKIFEIKSELKKVKVGSYSQFDDITYKTNIQREGETYTGRLEKKFMKLYFFQDGLSSPLVLRKFNIPY